MKIIALLGNNGGKCKKYSANNIIIKTNDTPRIQEAHTLIGHAICEIVESLLSKKRK
jgi:D-sedoheptulose 7-phosphate isomerase